MCVIQVFSTSGFLLVDKDLYGVFSYIYHKFQPNVNNIPDMDPMGDREFLWEVMIFKFHVSRGVVCPVQVDQLKMST